MILESEIMFRAGFGAASTAAIGTAGAVGALATADAIGRRRSLVTKSDQRSWLFKINQ